MEVDTMGLHERLVGARAARGMASCDGQEAWPREERFSAVTLEEVGLLLRQREEQGFAKGQAAGWEARSESVPREVEREVRTTLLLTLDIVIGEVFGLALEAGSARDAAAKAVSSGRNAEARARRAQEAQEAAEKAAAAAVAVRDGLVKLREDVRERGVVLS
jgi:ABC-type sugar transport system ATPase subunit